MTTHIQIVHVLTFYLVGVDNVSIKLVLYVVPIFNNCRTKLILIKNINAVCIKLTKASY